MSNLVAWCDCPTEVWRFAYSVFSVSGAYPVGATIFQSSYAWHGDVGGRSDGHLCFCRPTTRHWTSTPRLPRSWPHWAHRLSRGSQPASDDHSLGQERSHGRRRRRSTASGQRRQWRSRATPANQSTRDPCNSVCGKNWRGTLCLYAVLSARQRPDINARSGLRQRLVPYFLFLLRLSIYWLYDTFSDSEISGYDHSTTTIVVSFVEKPQ